MLGDNFMIFLIVGMVVGLSGLGLMMSGYRLLGVIVLMIGGGISLKGRNKLDKKL